MTTSLRINLRFLAAHGHCPPGLAGAIPTVPEWRLAALPRYIPLEDIEGSICSCDTTTRKGLRDRAGLLLLARLALGAGDVLNLCLTDIDWDSAQVSVCGKSKRETAHPLPQDVGNALRAQQPQDRDRHVREGRHPSWQNTTRIQRARREQAGCRTAPGGRPPAHSSEQQWEVR